MIERATTFAGTLMTNEALTYALIEEKIADYANNVAVDDCSSIREFSKSRSLSSDMCGAPADCDRDWRGILCVARVACVLSQTREAVSGAGWRLRSVAGSVSSQVSCRRRRIEDQGLSSVNRLYHPSLADAEMTWTT